MEKIMLVGVGEELRTNLQRILGGEFELTYAEATVAIMALNNGEFDGAQYLAEHKHKAVLAIVNQGDGERALKLGAREYVSEPINETALKKRIRNMFRDDEKDELTGLWKRESFYRRASDLLQLNREVPYYIVYLDISAFKVINDLFHAETGNLILKTAGQYFSSKINERVGVCGRIEADHFALCVPQDAINIERLIKEVDSVIRQLQISQNILFYAGVYPVSDVSLPVDQMCDRASMALNKIKGNYVTRYAYYDAGMRERLLRDQMIVRDMEYALLDNQFTIYLQPIYRPSDNKIVSAEALVRWIHPDSGLISPGFFIPVFERNGFIVKLDRYVWEMVCKFLRGRLNAGKKIVPVSVNVSRLNFYSFDLLVYLLNLLKKYDLEPSLLKLEVTESAYIDNPKQLVTIINQFKASGFPVLMDDFGAGYSSFNMLKDIQIDVLKVDMAFVREIEHSERARTILKMIVALAQELKMGVVTEGVETKTQLDYIMQMGNVDIQGYYFSKPLPIQDFNALLDKYE